MNNTHILIGLILAFIVCASGLIYSFVRIRQHTGEQNEVNDVMRRRRIILNPVFLAYILFAVITALIVGFFALMFKE